MWVKKAFIATLIIFAGAFVLIPKTKVARDFVHACFVPWYEQSFDCVLTCDSLTFSLVSPKLELSGVKVMPRSKSVPWHWECKQVSLSASWLSFLMHRFFNLSIILDHPTLFSGVQEKRISLLDDHITRYFSGSASLPFVLKELVLSHADMRVKDEKYNLELQSIFSCDCKKMKKGYGLTTYLEEGSLLYGLMPLVYACKGYWQSFFEPESGGTLLRGSGRGDITFFQGEHADFCYWEAKVNQGDTAITLWCSESDDACTFVLDKKGVLDVKLSLTLARIAEHLMPSVYASMVKGLFKGSYHAVLSDGIEKGQLTLTLNDGAYGNHKLFEEVVFLVPPSNDGEYRGDVALQLTEEERLSGAWSWEQKTKKGAARLVNAAGIELGSFSFLPDSDSKGGYRASSMLYMPGNELDPESTLLVKANARYNKGALFLQAERGKEQLFLEGTISDTFDISLLRWIDDTQKTLIDLSYDSAEKHHIKGVVDVGAAQRLAKHVWGVSIHGEGAVKVHGHSVNKRYELIIEGTKLAVRLPGIYNVINGLSGTFIFDSHASTLELSGVRCMLHRGSFSIPQASFHYDPVEEIIMYTIPLLLSSFWFNLEKDVYALLSGELTLKRTGATAPVLSGELIVERAHVSESLLNLPLLQKARPQNVLNEETLYPFELNVTVRSKNPIQVSLARLEGSAHIVLHVTHTFAEPMLSGMVRISEGKVVFPYKPLMIRKAQITFIPQQSYDPAIELLAKNRIKGFDVSLTVQGTLSSHDIRLQSTPPLSDEQLIGLLYAGSEQGALGALVPSMVMNNITSIFSKKGSSLAHSEDKNSWRERLKHIRVVPSFTDKHGRGGVRAALEIDINDRWRALMQKSFPLSEDTRFELDYDLSDDVSFRALRDERRDLGAEVEVKMKF